jgi:hypothetical protein
MYLPLTHIDGWPSKANALPGMAHFAGTGPGGKTCRDCVFRGYYREHGVKKHYGCQKFKSLTGNNGPVVQSDWPACRHFEQKPK